MRYTEDNRINGCLVSVIIPVYNVSHYVKQCIDSVIRQSHTNLEIILVDDGSTDSSGIICEEYSSSDDRIIVYHTENQGLSAARNYGIDRANGQYIAFLDSDDWMEHHAIQTLLSAAIMIDADIAACGYWREWVNRKQPSAQVDRSIVLSGDEILQSYLTEPFLCTVVWNKLYRTELFNSIRYPVGRIFEDAATTYRLLDFAQKVCVIPERLVHYRMRGNGLSQNHSIDSLIDHWRANKDRYDALNQKIQSGHIELVKGCLCTINRMWRWYAGCPKNERKKARPTIESMQRFAKAHFDEVMRNSNYSMLEKSACIFAKTDNPVIFMILNVAIRTYRLFNNRQRFGF